MTPLFGKDEKDEKKKKKKEQSTMGWDEEDSEEALEAEGLKRTEMDEGRVELIDKDSSTPVIETYDEDTGELEGSILLKDGNREGLLALVKIIEEVSVEQDHDAEIDSINFLGKLNVENPSKEDRLWDIDLTLNNIGNTNLESEEIKIVELGTEEDNNTDSRDFELTGDIKNLLLIKEYINTLPDADDILNIRDIEKDIDRIQEESTTSNATSNPPANNDEEEEEDEEEDDEVYEEDLEEDEEDDDEIWGDGGSDIEEYSLESYAIPIEKQNMVMFAIAMKSLFAKPIKNVEIVKNIPSHFSNVSIRDTTVGSAERQGDTIVWTIDTLDPERTVILKFTCDILAESIEAKETGTIKASYKGTSSFAEGLEIDKFDAYTRNRFYIDTIERDEEPEVWDCKLVFENTSEFVLHLLNADVYSPDDETTKLVDIDPNDIPPLPAGASWFSSPWEFESAEIPKFRKKLEFRVMPDFQTLVNGTISISDVELSVASITGDVVFSLKEDFPEREEQLVASEEGEIITVPTFRKKDVYASLRIENNGSAPLNKITVSQQVFDEEFQPPSTDEVNVLWDGDEIDLSPDTISIDNDIMEITFENLKESSTGMVEPDSELEIQYPIHCINPSREARFESEILYLANTYPLSQELEFRPEVPIIEAVHLRRKFRIGKEVMPIGALGNYEIILTVENIGEMTLENLVLMDKVPDSFEYGDYSMQPEITDEVGEDTLKWTIETLEPAKKLEISYQITGKGEYHPSDAQLAL
ncbi:MAG: hypothetical protein GF317_20220 [Candidatus Lokiarchaeota archaeon]|nr:hypothetical protein [Candidatus Lokiarchaeota archaeon]MBD3201809.1 hypothetical protein [Candidatus Lokiarchaeota archaeon]